MACLMVAFQAERHHQTLGYLLSGALPALAMPTRAGHTVLPGNLLSGGAVILIVVDVRVAGIARVVRGDLHDESSDGGNRAG